MTKDERIAYAVGSIALVGLLLVALRGNTANAYPNGINNLQPPGETGDNYSYLNYNSTDAYATLPAAFLPQQSTGVNGSPTANANPSSLFGGDCMFCGT